MIRTGESVRPALHFPHSPGLAQSVRLQPVCAKAHYETMNTLHLHERFAAVGNIEAKPRILYAGIGLRVETVGIPHGTTARNTEDAWKGSRQHGHHLHCNDNA